MRAMKNISMFFVSSTLLFSVIACSNPEGQSQTLYETAQFEEQQRNLKHARQLYHEIIREYPETSFASKVKARLETIKDEK